MQRCAGEEARELAGVRDVIQPRSRLVDQRDHRRGDSGLPNDDLAHRLQQRQQVGAARDRFVRLRQRAVEGRQPPDAAFGDDAIVDVDRGTDVAQESPAFVEPRSAGVEHPAILAVVAQAPILERAALVVQVRTVDHFLHGDRIVRMHAAVPARFARLVERLPGEVEPGRVEIELAHDCVCSPDQHRRAVRHHAESLLALAQLGERRVTLGDVAHETDENRGPADLRGAESDLDRDLAAVAMQTAGLDRSLSQRRTGLGGEPADRVQMRFAKRSRLQHRQVLAEELVGPPTGERLDSGVRKDDPIVQAESDDRVARRLEQRAIACLAGAQRRFGLRALVEHSVEARRDLRRSHAVRRRARAGEYPRPPRRCAVRAISPSGRSIRRIANVAAPQIASSSSAAIPSDRCSRCPVAPSDASDGTRATANHGALSIGATPARYCAPSPPSSISRRSPRTAASTSTFGTSVPISSRSLERAMKLALSIDDLERSAARKRRRLQQRQPESSSDRCRPRVRRRTRPARLRAARRAQRSIAWSSGRATARRRGSARPRPRRGSREAPRMRRCRARCRHCRRRRRRCDR